MAATAAGDLYLAAQTPTTDFLGTATLQAYLWRSADRGHTWELLLHQTTGNACSYDQQVRAAALHPDITHRLVFVELLYQGQQRLRSAEILLRRAGRAHRRNLLPALHDESRKKFFVRDTRTAEAGTQLLQRDFTLLPSGELPRPLRLEQPVLQIRIHPGVAGVVAVDAPRELDQFVDDNLVALSNSHVDR